MRQAQHFCAAQDAGVLCFAVSQRLRMASQAGSGMLFEVWEVRWRACWLSWVYDGHGVGCTMLA